MALICLERNHVILRVLFLGIWHIILFLDTGWHKDKRSNFNGSFALLITTVQVKSFLCFCGLPRWTAFAVKIKNRMDGFIFNMILIARGSKIAKPHDDLARPWDYNNHNSMSTMWQKRVVNVILIIKPIFIIKPTRIKQ